MSKIFEVTVVVRIESDDHSDTNYEAEDQVRSALGGFDIISNDAECLGIECADCRTLTEEEELIEQDGTLRCQECAEGQIETDLDSTYCSPCGGRQIVVNIRGAHMFQICTNCGKDI